MPRTLGITWYCISTLRNVVRTDVFVPKAEVVDVDLQDKDVASHVKDVE